MKYLFTFALLAMLVVPSVSLASEDKPAKDCAPKTETVDRSHSSSRKRVNPWLRHRLKVWQDSKVTTQ